VRFPPREHTPEDAVSINAIKLKIIGLITLVLFFNLVLLLDLIFLSSSDLVFIKINWG
jgi:hypothetical protein